MTKEPFDDNNLKHTDEYGHEHWQDVDKCPECKGEGYHKGKTGDNFCYTCNGDGVVVKKAKK